MDWSARAKQVFKLTKPEHFTDYTHCCECEEHDTTLRSCDVDSIGLGELGNPGWDPMCFATAIGKLYYTPALVRLSLDTLSTGFYLEQFLFHLNGDGENNEWVMSCNQEQRTFICDFLTYILENYADVLDVNMASDDLLRAYMIWGCG